jgi:hypothetical protein
VIESRDAALHFARFGCLTLRFDSETAHDIDPLSGSNVFQGDPGPPYGEHFANRRPVQPSDAPSSSAKEDLGQCVVLGIVGILVDVEDDVPLSARYNVVEVPHGKDDAVTREVSGVGVAFFNEP